MVTDLRSQLQRDEGFRPRPYKDDVGKLTIGYGFNLDAIPMPEAVAALWLDMLISEHRAAVIARVPESQHLDEVRRDVLVNMSYNMGIDGLLAFKKFRIALAARDYARAAEEMLDSKWAHQVGDRALRLATQMRVGKYQ